PPAATARPGPDHDGEEKRRDREKGRDRDRDRATCRTQIKGSRATAFCHNPYPETDRVRLHVECARWWDVDVDSAPEELHPAGYVQLSDRCWKEVRSVWVTHERVS
ncbi:hypothetical protein, partial [Streptomyces sp. SID3212]|uniref:hypothetical protein n=1 Tax=Streptomyces sp. SID3212 TaxID=2690259 RepID=UPI001F379585